MGFAQYPLPMQEKEFMVQGLLQQRVVMDISH
jgi:hypothetical protein